MMSLFFAMSCSDEKNCEKVYNVVAGFPAAWNKATKQRSTMSVR